MNLSSWISKKYLIFVGLLFFGVFGLIMLFPKFIHAAYKPIGPAKLKEGWDSSAMNLEKTGTSVLDIFSSSISYYLTGKAVTGESLQEEATNYQDYGLYGHLAYYTNSLYQQPASNAYYLADLFKKASPKQAMAAGFKEYPGGFKALAPVLKIWKVFRDIAYLFFIAIFGIVGLSIMFRKKLNPQTTVNLANSLPKIVIALILVTFSYTISAFTVDLLAVSTRVVGQVLTQGNIVGQCLFFDTTGSCDLLDLNLFPLINQIFINPEIEVGELLDEDNAAAGNAVYKLLNKIVKLTDIGGENPIVTLVFSIAIVFSSFKIFFQLLTKYVQIIIGTIFSPFIFLLSSFGQGGAVAMQWFKAQIANALAFPAVFLLIFLASYIVGSPTDITPSGHNATFTWAPELLGGEALTAINPSTGLPNNDSINAILGLGILLIIPSIPNMIENAIHGKGIQTPVDTSELKKAARLIPIVGQFIG